VRAGLYCRLYTISDTLLKVQINNTCGHWVYIYNPDKVITMKVRGLTVVAEEKDLLVIVGDDCRVN